MMRTTSFCTSLGTALLFTATSGAWAGDTENDANPGTSSPAQAQAAPAPEAPMPVPVAAPAQPAQVVMVEAGAPSPNETQPYKGWGRGLRAPIYVNTMMTAGAYGEDGSNRLTTRDSKILEGVGGVFRVGAVLDEHHRLGGRLQSFFRPTKKILRDTADTTTNDWGAVTFGYIGPEYIYATDFGLYAGASIGFGFAMSTKKLDSHDDHKNDNIERGSAGGAGILSLGYEWRANKWFAMNAEIYGGLYHGIDDNDKSMNGGLFGVGMGVGF